MDVINALTVIEQIDTKVGIKGISRDLRGSGSMVDPSAFSKSIVLHVKQMLLN